MRSAQPSSEEAIALRAALTRLDARVRALELRAAGAPSSARQRNGWASRFKGVSWHTASGKWRARTLIDGKRVSLGAYPSEDEAARAIELSSKGRP